MGRFRVLSAGDDSPQFVVRRDLSGGVNTRQNEQIIGENQATVLNNVNIDTAGERSIREGNTILLTLGSTIGTGMFGFMPDGGGSYLAVGLADTFRLLDSSGNIVSLASIPSFTANTYMTLTKAGELGENDVLMIGNGTEHWFRLNQSFEFEDLGSTSGTGSDSPPLSKVGTYYRNRFWILKDNELFFSSAFPNTYSTAFDTATDAFRIPVGIEKGIVGTRDYGLVLFGSDQIWALNPSVVPDPTTDKPESLITNIGCVNGDTIVPVRDDIYFLASDGVRGVFRTVQDKLQLGSSFPLSYNLKDEFDDINWAHIEKASAVYWQNRYMLSLPTGASSTPNKIWVYYPSLNAWTIYTGLNISRFATLKVGNDERLYGVDSTGKIWRMLSGDNDGETAITFTEESRSEDFGNPLQYKNGGEFKIKVEGGLGTLIISASVDGQNYVQMGTMSLALTGVNFPIPSFPIDFNEVDETEETFHLNDFGKFKRIKFKIYCNTIDAAIKILQTECITFIDEYQPEE